VLALGSDIDGVAMLQHQGGLSREVAYQKNTLASGSEVHANKEVKEKLDQLSAAVTAARNSVDPVSATSLQDMFTTFSNEIHSFLTQETGTDQTNFNVAVERHNGCISNHNQRTAASGDVTLNKEAVDGARLKHTACRKSEKSWDDLKGAADCWHTAMEAAKMHTSGNDNCGDIRTLKERLETDAKSYDDLVPTGKKESCSLEQIELESKFCEFRVSKVGQCSGLKQCVESVDLAGLKTTGEASAAEKRALWADVEFQGCQIGQLASQEKYATKRLMQPGMS